MVNDVRREEGATIIVITTAILLLLGFAALAVDAGLGYNDRRGTTNAADNAALAAAYEECNPTGTGAIAAARATAAANGYDDTSPETQVTANRVGEGLWHVTIEEHNEGVFGPSTPFTGDSLNIRSEATALCDPTEFLEGMAVFAGGEGCGPNELNMTGSSITIDGGIHSNEDLQIHATPDTEDLAGPISYRGTGTHGTHVSGPAMDYPLDIDIAEYRPGGDRANGSYFPSEETIDNDWLEDEEHIDPDSGLLTQSGIYYTSFSHNGQPAIDLHDISAAPGVTATFVSEGFIQLTGSFDSLRGHDAIEDGGKVGMLFFSDHPGPPPGSCNNNAVKVSSATFTNAAGVVYAPNGVIEFSNSTAELEGSVIGWRINAHGSDLSVAYQDDPAFEAEYQVELIK